MAQATEAVRADGAPKGTPYECFTCGYDTRRNPWSENKDHHGRPKDDGVGIYIEGVGVKHKTVAECMKIMNHFIDQKYDLSPSARHPEGEEVV